ncbi:hypothetical protein ACIQ1D_19600 [Lysinibacillus xylanilyticus]|uniref:hypothetical protein n=1 Tax=Lysinibacillus xylanilyticus TaxID=582475 RepID=UPI00382788F9
MNIIGYYKESPIINESGVQDEKQLYIVVFENGTKDGSKTWLEGYNIMQGHFELKDEAYLISCEKITKDEYMQATKGYFTPLEYLEENKEMKKQPIETWKNIFRNIQESDSDTKEEFGDFVEVIWLDSTDEWILGYGYEVFEDGFKTEKEARDRLNEIEKLLN